MIPDKLYRIAVSGTVHLDRGLAYRYAGNYVVDEYVLQPVAKRFADEKPEKDGEYWAKGTHYLRSIWALNKHESNPWMRCNYVDGIWYDENGSTFLPIYWCPVIYPQLPEGE